MTSLFPPRGICHGSRLAALAPQVTRVTQRLPASSNSSFRYHVPRRIAQLVVSTTDEQRESHSSRNAPPGYAAEHRGAPAKTGAVPWRNAPRSTSYNGRNLTTEKSQYRTFSIFSRPSTDSSLHNSLLQAETARPRTRSRVMVELQRRRYGMEGGGKEKDEKIGALPHKPTSDAEELHAVSSPHQEGFLDRIHMPQFHRPNLSQFHRPTKEELLAAATGFWSRLRVRFKWSTIRSVRPFNMDEITGFISWILLGHLIWIVIGTTTFVSLAILAINTVFAQETLAGWIGNYLTKSSGLKVVFESAVVPKWGDGVITFKNVFVSRRPGQTTKSSVVKGNAEAAAIAASLSDEIPAEDQNYTQFDITLGEVNVTLSFTKWWNSKGLLQNVEIKHVRGVVDRTHVFWTGEELDPKSYRHEHSPGDFEIDSFKIEDLLLTLHQPKGFRPFPISIYNADLPRLRKQWMFFDFLSATSMTGELDRSLFTIHPRQVHSYTGAQLNESDAAAAEPWKKQSRIRIDGLNIDHLNRGTEGPFSWIHEGNVDIIADIMIPNDTDESVMKVIGDFYDRMEATLTSEKHSESHTHDAEYTGAKRAHLAQPPQTEDDKRFLVMDLRVHLNDVRAVVPLFTRDVSFVNQALIRPIVAYINSRRTFIPINCRVVKRASDFDGSWTVFDSGLMDDLSAEVYDAFARDVTDEQARMRRFKKVGLWSLQLAVQAIFMGMAGNIA